MSYNAQEIMLGGYVQYKDFISLIRSFEVPHDGITLMLLEMQPRFVVKPEQRQDLLIFSEFKAEDNLATYTSGRIFHMYAELRWERQYSHVQVVYTGNEQYKPELSDSEKKTLDDCCVTKSYFLFGKRLDEGQIKRIGESVAQSGDFAEVRIPRLLRYPVLPGLAGAERVQLAVCEYMDRITGENIAYRFKELIPYSPSVQVQALAGDQQL